MSQGGSAYRVRVPAAVTKSEKDLQHEGLKLVMDACD